MAANDSQKCGLKMTSMSQCFKKKHSERCKHRAGCSKAEPKTFAPPQTPFPGARDGQSLISWRWSLPLPTNPVCWGSMDAISSYCGNRPTHPHTHPPTHKSCPPVANKQTARITIHFRSLACSVTIRTVKLEACYSWNSSTEGDRTFTKGTQVQVPLLSIWVTGCIRKGIWPKLLPCSRSRNLHIHTRSLEWQCHTGVIFTVTKSMVVDYKINCWQQY